MTFMYNRQAVAVADRLVEIPAVARSSSLTTTARAIAALALMAATIWCAYEAVSWQNEQQKIHEFQLGDRP